MGQKQGSANSVSATILAHSEEHQMSFHSLSN